MWNFFKTFFRCILDFYVINKIVVVFRRLYNTNKRELLIFFFFFYRQYYAHAMLRVFSVRCNKSDRSFGIDKWIRVGWKTTVLFWKRIINAVNLILIDSHVVWMMFFFFFFIESLLFYQIPYFRKWSFGFYLVYWLKNKMLKILLYLLLFIVL